MPPGQLEIRVEAVGMMLRVLGRRTATARLAPNSEQMAVSAFLPLGRVLPNVTAAQRAF